MSNQSNSQKKIQNIYKTKDYRKNFFQILQSKIVLNLVKNI